MSGVILPSWEPSLPPMSWLLTHTRDGWVLHHGSYVEVADRFFVEGGWAGPWDHPALVRACNVFGSGGVVSKDSMEIATPSHTLDCLYLLTNPDDAVTAISNSLPFLVEFAGINPPLDFRAPARMASVVLGLHRYNSLVLRDGSLRVERLFAKNCLWRRDGSITLKDKPKERRFERYSEYVTLLASVIRETFSNCSHPERAVRFTPLATCSSGYDSNASAALASDWGCKEAITIKTGRGGTNDSGARVGPVLGLDVAEYRLLEDECGENSAKEFFASGMGGEDLQYGVFEPRLSRRILVTGFHGDRVWSRRAFPSAVLERGDLSGCSLAEYRLRVGFVHVPVPFIAVHHHDAVHLISNCDEMAPFRVGRAYDRPIPRRVLEEKGVPRGWFGVRKKAVSVLAFRNAKALTLPSQRELRTLRGLLAGGKRLQYLRWSVSWWIRYFTLGWMMKLLKRIQYQAGPAHPIVRLASFAGDWRVFEHSHPFAAILFAWGLAGTRRRYRIFDEDRREGGTPGMEFEGGAHAATP
jgi:hypothetical protein